MFVHTREVQYYVIGFKIVLSNLLGKIFPLIEFPLIELCASKISANRDSVNYFAANLY